MEYDTSVEVFAKCDGPSALMLSLTCSTLQSAFSRFLLCLDPDLREDISLDSALNPYQISPRLLQICVENKYEIVLDWLLNHCPEVVSAGFLDEKSRIEPIESLLSAATPQIFDRFNSLFCFDKDRITQIYLKITRPSALNAELGIHLRRLAGTLEDNFSFSHGLRPYVMISDIEAIRHYFSIRDPSFFSRGMDKEGFEAMGLIGSEEMISIVEEKFAKEDGDFLTLFFYPQVCNGLARGGHLTLLKGYHRLCNPMFLPLESLARAALEAADERSLEGRFAVLNWLQKERGFNYAQEIFVNSYSTFITNPENLNYLTQKGVVFPESLNLVESALTLWSSRQLPRKNIIPTLRKFHSFPNLRPCIGDLSKGFGSNSWRYIFYVLELGVLREFISLGVVLPENFPLEFTNSVQIWHLSLSTFRFLYRSGAPPENPSNLIVLALKNKNFRVAKWLYLNFEISHETITEQATSESSWLETLKTLKLKKIR